CRGIDSLEVRRAELQRPPQAATSRLDRLRRFRWPAMDGPFIAWLAGRWAQERGVVVPRSMGFASEPDHSPALPWQAGCQVEDPAVRGWIGWRIERLGSDERHALLVET